MRISWVDAMRPSRQKNKYNGCICCAGAARASYGCSFLVGVEQVGNKVDEQAFGVRPRIVKFAHQHQYVINAGHFDLYGPGHLKRAVHATHPRTVRFKRGLVRLLVHAVPVYRCSLGAIVNPKLANKIVHMNLDGVFGERQPIRNDLVLQTFRQKLQDLSFAERQRLDLLDDTRTIFSLIAESIRVTAGRVLLD